MDREGKGFKATTDVLHFGSANKVVSKANYYIIKKKKGEGSWALWNAFSASSQLLATKVFDACLIDERENYMLIIPAVIVLKIYPNSRDIQGQTWWFLLQEYKEAKGQSTNSWICKTQLNSFLYKATYKGLQDNERNREEDGICRCKLKRKASRVDEKRQGCEVETTST